MAPDTDQRSSDRDRTDSPGMLGAAGNEPNLDHMEHAAPVGVPDEPGTADSPGTISTAGAPGSPSMPKNTDILGTAGNASPGASASNLEPGTPGAPGTPVPAPMGGQLASDKNPESPGPDSPSQANLGVGDTPTPGASGGEGDSASQPRYGASGTPGLGGARPRQPASGDGDAKHQGGDGDASGPADASGQDLSAESDEHGMRATGPTSGSGGSGIERLGGMPGGTSNYGGVGSPGGVSGPGGVSVLPSGGTRQTGRHDGDPLTLARQAGESAMDRGPTSTGGTLQRRTGPEVSTTPALGAASGAGSGGSASDAPSIGANQTDRREIGMENNWPNPTGADATPRTGMGAEENNITSAGAEAATRARSGGGATISGSPPPQGAPPAPDTPDPFGGTISESHADPGFPPPVPQQPNAGGLNEPGPEART